jgi:hypothetical protein
MSLSQPSGASRKNRSPISLSRRLERKLLGYAASASAAGMGMTGLAQPSQAKIVYTPGDETISANQALTLDLNNDGITDFTLTNIAGTNEGYISASPQAGNHVLMSKGFYASALPPGRRVGPAGWWKPSSAFMDFCSSIDGSIRNGGPWNNVKDHYLGLKFLIQGQTHFGWARLTVRRSGCKIVALLTGYAYETVSGKAIPTGKTSETNDIRSEKYPDATLGTLAFGSAGLVAWRRDDDANGERLPQTRC